MELRVIVIFDHGVILGFLLSHGSSGDDVEHVEGCSDVM